MITHFQYKPLFKQAKLPGWRISFYFRGSHYDGIYHKNGQIEWGSVTPLKEDETKLQTQIHELMLFHVYE
ncbi:MULTISPECIES: YheE family protein [Metabacillus]|uniref:YheE family protein n=1 Tax=Metabacillus endolithicus TaxID=1535204 RepID=A0ABW5C542_9BACI|nr:MULTISPECIES: YheE family protein [Metabacillus]MCM3162011.1 YheE family protein [Metabacillus litoralis]MCM3411344.1 YheE family protein [Metabacillus litoralis]UHA60404.1 YheE family protein [Metabacillus litoralis]UPG62268.1 YheE family protein [Metabacillus endolithicus]